MVHERWRVLQLESRGKIIKLIYSLPNVVKYLGALRIETTYHPITLGTVLERHIEEKEVAQATAFLETLLKVRAEDRARPEDIIDHPWFSD